MEYTKALADLVEEFRKYPGVGPKSAQRMAFALLKKSHEDVNKFMHIVRDAKNNIKYCKQCFNLCSETDLCEICSKPERNQQELCVIENVKDLIALERSQEYKGLYHVLGGIISPLDGISAADLNISELKDRIAKFLEADDDTVLELILALNLSTEGEATMLYLKRFLAQEFPLAGARIKVTRLAYGLPIGADLDYTDEGTIAKALQARVLC